MCVSQIDLAFDHVPEAGTLPGQMQADPWREQLDTLNAQAEEMRTQSTQVAADVAKPIKRGMDEFKKAR
jgi:hypothetical protein